MTIRKDAQLMVYKQSSSHSNKVSLYPQIANHKVYIKQIMYNRLRVVGRRKSKQQNPVGSHSLLLVVVGNTERYVGKINLACANLTKVPPTLIIRSPLEFKMIEHGTIIINLVLTGHVVLLIRRFGYFDLFIE